MIAYNVGHCQASFGESTPGQGIALGVLLARQGGSLLPEEEAPTGPPLKLDQAQVYTIKLPRTTAWEPEGAYRFMERLLHTVPGLTFRIVAEHDRSAWQIVDLRSAVEPSVIKQAVRTAYPEAEVEGEPLEALRGSPSRSTATCCASGRWGISSPPSATSPT